MFLRKSGGAARAYLDSDTVSGGRDKRCNHLVTFVSELRERCTQDLNGFCLNEFSAAIRLRG